MRPFIIPFSIWLAALQVPFHPAEVHGVGGAGELISVAVGLAGLTVAVYRLGVWRQEMHNTKKNVSAELARFREETRRSFGRLERRLDALERGRQKTEAGSLAGGAS